MGRLYSKSSRPELGSLYSWRVNSELLRFGTIGRSRLETRDIRAMSKLCLSIAADDVQTICLWNVVSLLFLGGEILERVGKHSLMESEW